jgi:hypothetical protein
MQKYGLSFNKIKSMIEKFRYDGMVDKEKYVREYAETQPKIIVCKGCYSELDFTKVVDADGDIFCEVDICNCVCNQEQGDYYD